jgi:hypothetical protein
MCDLFGSLTQSLKASPPILETLQRRVGKDENFTCGDCSDTFEWGIKFRLVYRPRPPPKSCKILETHGFSNIVHGLSKLSFFANGQ